MFYKMSFIVKQYVSVNKADICVERKKQVKVIFLVLYEYNFLQL
jgi:hypothetical protein